MLPYCLIGTHATGPDHAPDHGRIRVDIMMAARDAMAIQSSGKSSKYRGAVESTKFIKETEFHGVNILTTNLATIS